MIYYFRRKNKNHQPSLNYRQGFQAYQADFLKLGAAAYATGNLAVKGRET
jgi:hypothetical protein